MTAFTLFDTPIGRCAIAWEGDLVVGLQLPEARADDTRERMHDRFEDADEIAPPSSIQHVIEAVEASLRGEADDLADVPLALDDVPPFARRVYEVVRTIPAGETLSYGDVALAAGSPGAARAVGQALGRNPFPIVVPCHRVLAAGGRIGGFSATGGTSIKAEMLAVEGVRPRPQPARRRSRAAPMP
jgi:methylated-DNA-[protein]-cysteine S-methyltransferase